MRQLLLAASLVLGTVGCVGGISGGDDVVPPGDDGTTGDTARVLFERDVYPIISANCGAGCHLVGSTPASTPFVATTKAESYLTATGYDSVVGNFTEAGAPIWTKIVPGPHNSRTYNADQQLKISAWLAKEVQERSGTNPTDPPPTESPGQATARLISEWSGCLNVQDFIDTRFGESWANQGSDAGNCENCHSTGAYGMFANDDNAMMYEVLSTRREYMLFFFKADVTITPAAMATNEQHFITLGLAQPPHQEHPEFNPNQANNGLGISPVANLTELYNRTMAHKAAGTCGPPRIQ